MVPIGMRMIGDWIREARVDAGLGQAQLARMSDVHQSTISRLENAKLDGLSLHLLARLVVALASALGTCHGSPAADPRLRSARPSSAMGILPRPYSAIGMGCREYSAIGNGRAVLTGPAHARPRAARACGAYQAVAVVASLMPSCSSQRSASIAALQPSAAAVTAWR